MMSRNANQQEKSNTTSDELRSTRHRLAPVMYTTLKEPPFAVTASANVAVRTTHWEE